MKQRVKKLRLSKETVRNLSAPELAKVMGGATVTCVETGMSYCIQCATEGSCISGDTGSCDTYNRKCC